jgi:hypothetical protein
MRTLCKDKFKVFGHNSEFRAGAYAIQCSNISIGDNVVVRPLTMFFADEFAEIVIKNDVMMRVGAHFYVNNHKFDRRDIPLIEKDYYPRSQS